jgi:hypothetical protein
MNILKHILNFLLSLRTTLWFLGIMLTLLLAGAFIMPGKREFQMLHSVPLLDWLEQNTAGITWWLWGLILVLSVLALNTLFCSVESIIKKRRATHWLLLISPQIIHIGFIFMLLAHLLSAAGGSQGLAQAVEGSMLTFSDNTVMKVKEIKIDMDSRGYMTDWKVDVEYLLNGKLFKQDTIRPNSPSLLTGFNVNVKDLRPYPRKMILLQVNKDPGAIWALAGGILFMIGISTLLMLKIRMEK